MNHHFRIVIRMFCVIVLSATIAIGVMNQSSLARVRSEHQALLRDQGECERLSAENAEDDQLHTTNETVQKLRKDNSDLPRLRNEIRRMREAAAEATRLRDENQRLATAVKAGTAGAALMALPADFLVRAKLVDAGLSTPEATVQTFFHAMMQGDTRRAMQCHLGEEGRPMTKEQLDSDSAHLKEESADFAGFRIAEKNAVSADEVELGIQCAPGGVIAPLKLKLVGGEWKFDQ